MFHSLYSQLSFVALFGCCALALWKGGPAERGGALLICGTWLAAMLGLALARQYVLAIPFLLSDAVLAVGLLILAIRYSSWWMGAAMLLQAIGLSFHAAYFAADPDEISRKVLHFYVMGKNLSSWGMLLVILVGTLASWRKRTRGEARSRATADSALPSGVAHG
jgi:hypothetical protein